MRLIDADALAAKLRGVAQDTIKRHPDPIGIILHDLNMEIAKNIQENEEECPTIEAEPVRHGRWISVGLASLKCSKCKYVDDYKMYYKRCPECGTKMDGGKHDEAD